MGTATDTTDNLGAATVLTAGIARDGEPRLVTVKVALIRRLPAFVITGGALKAHQVKETAERVRSAITETGFDFPRCRVEVEVVDGEGLTFPGLDLAIAQAILVATKQVEAGEPGTLYYGELSLAGRVRAVRGTVGAVLVTPLDGILVTAPEGAAEAALHGRPDVLVVALDTLNGTPARVVPPPVANIPAGRAIMHLEVEVHRTAQALHKLLGGLPDTESRRTVALIHSAAGLEVPKTRPFRAPHHTITVQGLVGTDSRPGEIALARHGLLVLDEADLFSAEALEAIGNAPADVAILACCRASSPRLAQVRRALGIK